MKNTIENNFDLSGIEDKDIEIERILIPAEDNTIIKITFKNFSLNLKLRDTRVQKLKYDLFF